MSEDVLIAIGNIREIHSDRCRNAGAEWKPAAVCMHFFSRVLMFFHVKVVPTLSLRELYLLLSNSRPNVLVPVGGKDVSVCSRTCPMQGVQLLYAWTFSPPINTSLKGWYSLRASLFLLHHPTYFQKGFLLILLDQYLMIRSLDLLQLCKGVSASRCAPVPRASLLNPIQKKVNERFRWFVDCGGEFTIVRVPFAASFFFFFTCHVPNKHGYYVCSQERKISELFCPATCA